MTVKDALERRGMGCFPPQTGTDGHVGKLFAGTAACIEPQLPKTVAPIPSKTFFLFQREARHGRAWQAWHGISFRFVCCSCLLLLALDRLAKLSIHCVQPVL
jgi:hypothetical protein